MEGFNDNGPMSDRTQDTWTGFLPKKSIGMAKKRRAPTVLNLELTGSGDTPTNLDPTGYSEDVALKGTDTLDRIATDLAGCTRCKLSKARHTIVLGEGNPNADLVFVGEGPGEQEDLQGRPFIGRAGQLLDKMIGAMGLSREQVYILNVVKCRPPGNRNPEPDEIATCGPFLLRQLNVIQPKVIVALGKFSAQTLLQTETPISQLRGKFHPYHGGTKLMPTFHPAYLLRNPPAKKEVWIDLQLVAQELGIEIPKTVQKN